MKKTVKTILAVLLIGAISFLFFFRDLTPVFKTGYFRNSTKYIVIHHDQIAGLYLPIREMYEYHTGTRNFRSIAYHYIIDKDGTVYQLHYNNEKTDHCGLNNDCSIAVCLHGDFNNEKPTILQKVNLNILLIVLRLKLDCDTIIGHRNLKATDCPGKNIDLNEILWLK